MRGNLSIKSGSCNLPQDSMASFGCVHSQTKTLNSCQLSMPKRMKDFFLLKNEGTCESVIDKNRVGFFFWIDIRLILERENTSFYISSLIKTLREKLTEITT